MKRCAFAFAMLGCACGGSGGGADAQPIDAPAAFDAPVAPDPCDTVGQDCLSGQKCSIVIVGGALGRHCTPTGTVALGGACTRTSTRTDDCAAGLACSDDGACRPLCIATDGCAVGDQCIQFGTLSDGLCWPPCTSTFDPAACASGFTCDVGLHLGNGEGATYCRTIGPQALGASCTAAPCAATLDCDVDGVCHALCDAGHPCPGGAGTCHFAQGAADGLCF